METIAVGRAKRATAGNRMRELLERAHQQDEEELFKEEEGDDEFKAPADQRDVFLEDFADTDDEVELGSSDEERAIRREERRKAKGKSKASYNPLAPTTTSNKIKSVKFPSEPTASPALPKDAHLLDPNVDPSLMAPSTLLLTLRKKRREQKRLARDQVLRSSLRASTLRTEEDMLEKERLEKENRPKGKRAQHETGQIKVVKRMTQDELIAAALEEEERNKEALRDWVRREEERRELRRVGRKRVVGPRWTWVTRTVGKVVEEVEDEIVVEAAGGKEKLMKTTKVSDQPAAAPVEATTTETEAAGHPSDATEPVPIPTPAMPDEPPVNAEAGPSKQPTPPPSTDKPAQPTAQAPQPPPSAPAPDAPAPADTPSQYTRNYIILSEIPGGLAAELRLILGDHVEWDQVKYIPHRNRPMNRRPQICPFTGLPAKYRHPTTNVPYATIEGYKQIQALLQHRYVWDETGGAWFGGEEDMGAEGVEGVEGWAEAVNGGWVGGVEIGMGAEEGEGDVGLEGEIGDGEEGEVGVEGDGEEGEGEIEVEVAVGKGKKRKAGGAGSSANKKSKAKSGKAKGKAKGRS